MNTWRKTLIVLVALFGLGAVAAAEELDPVPVLVAEPAEGAAIPAFTRVVPDPRFQIGVDVGWTTGDNSWEISFMDFEPGIGLLSGRSRLEWEDLDAIVYRLHAEFRIAPWLRVSGSVGMGDIDDGQNTDSDWFDELFGRDFLFSRSIAETDGDLSMFDVNVYFRLNEFINLSRIGGVWDFFVGYQYHEEDLRDRNGVQTVFFEEVMYEPFDGLNSTYAFEWQAVRLGLRGEIPLSQRFRMRATLAALVGAEFNGEAFWNLRDDFRDTSPNFEQSASGGFGGDIRLSGVFDFNENFYAEIGWWAFYLKAKNGTDKTYFADGDTGRSDLDWVESQRTGMFLGVGGRF